MVIPVEASGQTHEVFKDHRSARLCKVWLVQRISDLKTFAWTDHDRPVETRNGGPIPGIFDPRPGTEGGAIRKEAGLADMTTELRGLVAEDLGETDTLGITIDDLRARSWIGARVFEAIVDYRVPWVDPVVQNEYRIFDIDWDDLGWTATCLGKTHLMRNSVGDVLTKLCGNELGVNDGVRTFCGVAIAFRTVTNTLVVATPTRRNFRIQSAGFSPSTHPENYFQLGHLLSTDVVATTKNAGLKRMIEYSSAVGGTPPNYFVDIRLYNAYPFTVAGGHTFNAIGGCDKTVPTCQTKFSAYQYFRAAPDQPGIGRLTQTPSGSL